MIGPAGARTQSPRLADHRSQAAHTAMLPTVPPKQALMSVISAEKMGNTTAEGVGKMRLGLVKMVNKTKVVAKRPKFGLILNLRLNLKT